jgi:hypothetical protein
MRLLRFLEPARYYRRLKKGVTTVARRMGRTPFRPGEQRVIVHCSHHKVGTVWFRNVLNAVAAEYGLRCRDAIGGQLQGRGAPDIILDFHSAVDLSGLARVRGSHMIRDPRDVVVSGYFYHLWSRELWLHEPRPELGGRSYQQHLRGLNQEEGLAFEMENLTESTIRGMMRWNYRNPVFMEIRYEDILKDEPALFAALFAHYGFQERAIARSVRLAGRFSFQKVTHRRVGEVGAKTHLRSGQPGQWQQYLTVAHREQFRRLFPGALDILGYESGNEW